MKQDARWAKIYRRYLIDPELIGWLWPWHYYKILRLLEKHDPKWVAKNHDKILPPVPIESVEKHRVAIDDQLLV